MSQIENELSVDYGRLRCGCEIYIRVINLVLINGKLVDELGDLITKCLPGQACIRNHTYQVGTTLGILSSVEEWGISMRGININIDDM